jgi:CheY-like chemotaxis protein
MPEMNGFELCKELIKKDHKAIFFISAYVTYGDNLKV